MFSGAILALFFNIIIQKLWPSFHNIYNVCNVELSLSGLKKKKKKKKNWKTYFCRKKRTAVFPFKKRTKYGKNVLVGSSDVKRENLEEKEKKSLKSVQANVQFGHI